MAPLWYVQTHGIPLNWQRLRFLIRTGNSEATLHILFGDHCANSFVACFRVYFVASIVRGVPTLPAWPRPSIPATSVPDNSSNLHLSIQIELT